MKKHKTERYDYCREVVVGMDKASAEGWEVISVTILNYHFLVFYSRDENYESIRFANVAEEAAFNH